jgi:small subunit ribosomal protein S6
LNYYETLYIVHPALESGRLKDIILSLEESLEKLGGKTLSIDLLGKKRMAYLIDRQKYGTYVQHQFSGEGNCISSLRMELDHNPNVLSYLTTLIEKSDVTEQGDDIDTQIAGQSREGKQIDNQIKNEAEKPSSDKGKSVKDEDTTVIETEISESTEEFVEKSDEAGSLENPISEDDVDNYGNKLEEKEVDPSKNIASVEENQENMDKISEASKEE